MWDLDARNHEVTLLKIKHIRLKEKYGEGEIPHQAKTGSGPILLTFSFPYVRDWLNEHPSSNRHEALLRVMESLLRRNYDILAEDKVKSLAAEWNKQHCVPPLENGEFNKQWRDAVNFIKNKTKADE